jgi:hypothetical protein
MTGATIDHSKNQLPSTLIITREGVKLSLDLWLLPGVKVALGTMSFMAQLGSAVFCFPCGAPGPEILWNGVRRPHAAHTRATT